MFSVRTDRPLDPILLRILSAVARVAVDCGIDYFVAYRVRSSWQIPVGLGNACQNITDNLHLAGDIRMGTAARRY